MKVRRYFTPRNTYSDDQEEYKEASKRGYVLRERKLRTRERKFVNRLSITKTASLEFQNSYDPEELLGDSSLKLKMTLLGKWLTYSSGFVVPTDTFERFTLSLKDGVILSKLMYNYFLINDRDYYTKELAMIQENLILNPRSELEEIANFTVFTDSCSLLGIDVFNCVKYKHTKDFKIHFEEIVEKLLVLEEVLFIKSAQLTDEDTHYQLDQQNLNVLMKSESTRLSVQQKRLTSYYLLALKNRKRVLKERIDAYNIDLVEETHNMTYLDAAGSLQPPPEFWLLTVDEEKEAEQEETRPLESNKVSKSTKSAEIVELDDLTSASSYDSRSRSRAKSTKESVFKDNEEKSQIYYILSPGDDREKERNVSEQEVVNQSKAITNPEILNNEQEEMSLSSKMDLLFDAKQDVESIKSTKSLTYYVIEELNEVDKGLTAMTDNILRRLASLKVKDRVVRAMDLFSVKDNEPVRVKTNNPELADITENLEDISILKPKDKEIEEAEEVISGFF